jgi:hypothetical protein
MTERSRGLSRRRLLGGAAALGAVTLTRPQQAAAAESDSPTITAESCFGEHQAGLQPPLPAHATFIGLDLP